MHCLEYEIIESNIQILNVKLKKIHIRGDKLLLSKPNKLFKNKYRLWINELNSLFEEERIIYELLLIEYKKIEKILSK